MLATQVSLDYVNTYLSLITTISIGMKKVLR